MRKAAGGVRCSDWLEGDMDRLAGPNEFDLLFELRDEWQIVLNAVARCHQHDHAKIKLGQVLLVL